MFKKNGRPSHIDYPSLKFEVLQDGTKRKVVCCICKKIMKNTSILRLQGHRNVCVFDDITEDYSPTEEEYESVEEIEVPVLESTSEPYEIIAENSSHILIPEKKIGTRKTKQKQLTSFFDTITESQSNAIDLSLGRFFFATSTSFRVIENKYFQEFISILRPSYKLPNRKQLSTTILDAVVIDTEKNVQSKINKDSVLIIDGWKNTTANIQIVACILHNAEGGRAFLDAFNFTAESLSESADNLNKKLEECKQLARNKFQSNIYAVVSDNARNMMAMGNLSSLWHSTCSSHTGNLLLKDLLDFTLLKKVVDIVKQFRNSGPANAIKLQGGTKLMLPVDTRWCTYRDTFNSYIRNIQAIKNVIAGGCFKKYISAETIKYVYDDEFEREIISQITLMDPVCEIIQNCQSLDYSIADACEAWNNLELPSNFDDVLTQRKVMAVNIFSKVANYLHPSYRGRTLSSDDIEEVEVFLIKELDENGLDSFQHYKQKTGFFEILESKKMASAVVYWKCAACSSKHQQLARIALKLITIPAASAEVERIFSNWQFIHGPLRNRLDFEKSKKLLEVYYNLNKVVDAEETFEDFE